jgi:hypothetical protein
MADELDAGTGRLGLGVADHAQARGVLGQFGTDFALETRPTVHKQRIH